MFCQGKEKHSLNVKETESAVFLFPAKAKEDEIVGVVMCVGALNRGSCVLVVSVAAKALCQVWTTQ